MGDGLSLRGIEKFLVDKENFNISVLDCVTSTNALLKREAAENAEEGRIIIAESQTEGRGRFVRKFHSPKNCGIYMSILLKPKIKAEDSVMITAAAAAAVADSIEAITQADAQIKWVNDVLLNEKKVCGILTEGLIDVRSGGFSWVVLGIGINAYEPEEGYPSDISNIAGAVFEKRGDNLRNELTAEVINRFWSYYLHLSEKSFYASYKKRMMVLGREINVIRNDDIIAARAINIDENCRLLVEYENREREYLSSGEISIKIKK